MDAGAAASFYRRKGYTVRENVRATGASGNEHRVPLLAEGPLGSLAVFFGGLDGVDGPEMGGARKVARDLGATPVLAAAGFSNQDRQTAARLGVVLLDDDAVAVERSATLAPPPADPARAWPGLVPAPPRGKAAEAPELAAHPWPASGRVGGHDGPGARAVDVDELLAPRRRAEASAPSAPANDLAAPAVLARAAMESETVPAPATAPEGEADSFWSRPRRSPTPPSPSVRGPRPASARPFAWLDGEAAPMAAGANAAAPAAVEYDEVVHSRRPALEAEAERLADEALGGLDGAAPAAMGSPDERTARPPSLERRIRRARLQRRLIWTLVASVLVYLFLLWWY